MAELAQLEFLLNVLAQNCVMLLLIWFISKIGTKDFYSATLI